MKEEMETTVEMTPYKTNEQLAPKTFDANDIELNF